MMACEFGGTLDDLLARPAVELRLFGSDGENDDDSGRDDDDDDDGDDEDDDDADGEDKSKSRGSKKPKAPTAAEVAAMQRRIANFDEERDRDKGKLKKATDSIKDKDAEIARLKKDGVKDEEVKQDNVKLERENAELLASLNELRIQIAFMGDTTHKWANPARAAKLLNLSNVEIDDKGTVTGLKTAADELAASDAYLLAKQDDDSDDGGDTEDEPKTQRRTGDQPKPQRKGSARSQQARDDKLRSRFTGLRR